MLNINGLHVRVGEGRETREILQGIDLELAPGRMYAITGPNGSGKSTLARAVMGMVPVAAGTIRWNGQELTALSVDERARLGIRYAFQQPPRFKGLRIRRLMELASGEPGDVPSNCRALRQVGLCPEQYLDRPADAGLSGGEMRRLEIAQLLVSGAGLLIFDEPEAGVDLWTFEQLLHLIGEVHRANPERTTIVITHNEHFLRLADQIIILAEGRIERIGTPGEILSTMVDDLACKWRQACGGDVSDDECYRVGAAK